MGTFAVLDALLAHKASTSNPACANCSSNDARNVFRIAVLLFADMWSNIVGIVKYLQWTKILKNTISRNNVNCNLRIVNLFVLLPLYLLKQTVTACTDIVEKAFT